MERVRTGRRSAWRAWFLFAILAAAMAGCAAESANRVDTDGPPPDGFASWDEYWENQDKLNRDFEHGLERGGSRTLRGAGQTPLQ